MARNTPDTTDVVVPATVDTALAMFASMVEAIPTPDGDGSANVAAILMATDWDAINPDAGDGLPGARDMVARELVIESVTRHDSTLADSGPYFLVAQAHDRNTGEVCTFQTSAIEVMAVLVKLHFSDAFPAVVRLDPVPTKQGRTIVKPRVLAASQAPKALASA